MVQSIPAYDLIGFYIHNFANIIKFNIITFSSLQKQSKAKITTTTTTVPIGNHSLFPPKDISTQPKSHNHQSNFCLDISYKLNLTICSSEHDVFMSQHGFILPTAKYSSIIWLYHFLFVHSLADDRLGSFYFPNAAINVSDQVFV